MLTRERTFSKKKLAGIVSSAIVSGIGMLILGFIFSKRKRNLRKKKHWERRQEDMELPVFDMSTIAHATDTFSENNKLGEGVLDLYTRYEKYMIPDNPSSNN